MTVQRQRIGRAAEDLVAARLARSGWEIVERPILGVDRRKQQRVRRLATAWMGERREAPRYTEIRFDAVGVTFDRADRPVDVEHIRGAF
jgi:Holliday junction resolvase-like predicted endonuclease